MILPFFPLQSIFFPGETVPLHIFEERYKQLISDCKSEAMTFGIPVFIDNGIAYGTEVQLVEIVTTYENGEMDVVCVARQVFKVETFENQLNGKLYAGGKVSFLENVYNADDNLKHDVLDGIKALYDMMEVPFSPIPIDKFHSFVLVHKMGLSMAQEYQLLLMTSEQERLSFIKEHLRSTMAVLSEVDRTKKTIELNGHFKNFDPLDFKGFNVKE